MLKPWTSLFPLLLFANLYLSGCSGSSNSASPSYHAMNSMMAADAAKADEPEKEDSTDTSREAYDHIVDNAFLDALSNPLSTFSIDVDTASYSNIRRMLQNGQRPPRGSVRLEECINYFDYHYQPPTGDQPFSVAIDSGECPWNRDHQLLRIAIQGRYRKAWNAPKPTWFS